jgi:hypothetical protein
MLRTGLCVLRFKVRKRTFSASLTAPVSFTAQETAASFRKPFQTARGAMDSTLRRRGGAHHSNAIKQKTFRELRGRQTKIVALN